MRLTIVGCAGSFPGPNSAASCYLVEGDDDAGRTWRVLLDLGSGALGPLQRLTDPSALDAVLLSHLHPDHMLDLCGLFVLREYSPERTAHDRLVVYGPSGTRERIASAYGSEAAAIERSFDVRQWQDGAPVTIGPLVVTPRRVLHSVEAYGLRVEHRSAALAYSGDTDACPGLLKVAESVGLLLAEASFQEGRETVRGIHLTGRRAGETARDAGVGRLVLTHVPAWTDRETVLAEARGAFDGPVDLAISAACYDL